MSNKIEISPYGSLLVYQKGYTPEFVFETIKKNNLRGLRIFAVLKEDLLEDISFLKDYDFLEELDITGFSADYNFGFLKSLTKLKNLSINAEGKNEIDFSGQVNLEYLTINWRKNIRGINHCQKLKKIILVEYKEINLAPINELGNLEELIIKTGTLKNLDGVENNYGLLRVELGYCKSLVFIKALNGLEKLKSLRIEKCPSIRDYENLTKLHSIEELLLIDCKGVKSIKFINNFPSLRKLSILGNTEIVDGDLIPAKNIKEVFYDHKEHYNIKIENKEYNKLKNNNLKKIRDIFKKK